MLSVSQKVKELASTNRVENKASGIVVVGFNTSNGYFAIIGEIQEQIKITEATYRRILIGLEGPNHE